jgi:hypothetical protein
MHWYVAVVCRIVTGYIAIPILLKPIVDKYPHTTMLLLQFVCCFAVALPVAVALNQHRIDWMIVAVGFVNGLAAYCYRKAITISLSRTALLAFWDDLLAMGLSYVLLQEGQFLTTGIVLGMGASLGAVILFTVHSYRKQQAGKDGHDIIPKRLYLLAGTYSVILGVGVFFMRYLGVKNTGLGTFLTNWYGGVVLAAGLLFLAAPKEEGKDLVVFATLPRQDLLRVLGLSFLVLVTMSAAYTAYRLAPQTVVQPLFLVAEMIAPALIGLYVFAEREALDRQEHLYFGLGLAGGLLVALSFSGVL